MPRSDKLFQKKKGKERAWRGSRRAPNAKIRQVKKRVLITCEGQVTEPSYLSALISHLGISGVDFNVVDDCGSAPISVVKAALTHLKDDHDYDAVFCIFDKDNHETYSTALNILETAAKAKKYAKLDYMVAITSVPCFELWFLMHFEPHNKPYGGKTPAKELVSELKSKPGFENYHKGCDEIFPLLAPHTETALKNSRSVFSNTLKSGGDNPSTLMHVLVSYLISLK